MTGPPASPPYFASLVAPARVESVRACACFLVQAARSLKVPSSHVPTFEVAIVEALTNALKHGTVTGSDGSIVCELELKAGVFAVRILDAGAGFVLEPVGLPAVSPDDVQSIPESGYGLPVIQAVFPAARTVVRHGLFGIELPLEL